MNTKWTFHKERNLQEAIADGWRFLAIYWRAYFKSLWCYLLLAGSACALLWQLLMEALMQHALPALRLSQAGADSEVVKAAAWPDWTWLLYLITGTLLSLSLCWLCLGRTLHLIERTAQAERLVRPLRLSLQACECSAARRVALTDCVLGTLMLALAAGIGYAAWKWSVWVALLLPLLLIYIGAATTTARVLYGLGQLSPGRALLLALGRCWGRTFVVQLLLFFPFALLCVAAALAPMSQLGVWCAATDSWLLGDGLGLPQGLALLYFALNTVAFSFILLCHTWMLWPLALYPYVQHAAQPEAETCQA